MSKQLGEQEVRRETRSVSEGKTANQSTTSGENVGTGRGSSFSHAENESIGRTYADWELQGRNRGLNRGDTDGTNESQTSGTSFSQTGSVSASTTDGRSEGVHRRPLLHPDEIGRFLSRIDETRHPGYPGLMACLLPGRQPLIVRRVNYFQAAAFGGLFDPHPDHPPPPTLLYRDRMKLFGPKAATKADDAPPAKPTTKPRDETANRSTELPPQGASAKPTPSTPTQPPPLPPKPPPKPQPRVTQPIPPMADLLREAMNEARQADILPPPLPPPLPYQQTIRPAEAKRRFSIGNSILPILILGTAALAVVIWVAPRLGSLLPVLPAAAGHSAVFNSGYAARRSWEGWINGLSGPAKDGALFWAGERSKRAPGSCQDGDGQTSDVYRNACFEAQRYLGPTDQRRLREPEYRAGWNSY